MVSIILALTASLACAAPAEEATNILWEAAAKPLDGINTEILVSIKFREPAESVVINIVKVGESSSDSEPIDRLQIENVGVTTRKATLPDGHRAERRG